MPADRSTRDVFLDCLRRDRAHNLLHSYIRPRGKQIFRESQVRKEGKEIGEEDVELDWTQRALAQRWLRFKPALLGYVYMQQAYGTVCDDGDELGDEAHDPFDFGG